MPRSDSRTKPVNRGIPAPSLLLVFIPIILVILGLCVTIPYLETPLPPMAMEAAVGGPFELRDGSGQVVTDRSWPGKFLLIYFGYTHCPSVCPTTLANIGGALDSIGKTADRVQPLFITIDPARDTSKVVAEYAQMFWPRLVGLTGTSSQIAQAAKEYDIYYAPHRDSPTGSDYSMDHTSVVYLVAPDGRIAATIDASRKAPQMAASITSAMNATRSPA
ncbi:SCO family protein [Lichenicola sp.]|uniref:SCO family protein n=1 Tax=Lichenicola sp. TaxID=2804529 RepID=UPI003AFFCD2C